MPPCRLRRRKFWKFDYEMVHSGVYLCCQNSAVLYTCLPWLLSNVQKTALVLHVSLFNFSSIFPGGSTGPICTYVRTPMIFKVACMAGVLDRWCVKTKWSWELASDTRRFVLRDVRRYGEYRDGHGLGPSTGWVGLGRFFQHMWWVTWVGLNKKYCYFFHCILCLL